MSIVDFGLTTALPEEFSYLQLFLRPFEETTEDADTGTGAV